MARRAGPGALVLLACLAVAAAATDAAKIQPSVNMTDPCYTNPAADSCVDFQRAPSEWTSDLETLCAEMPFMVGCSIWAQCTSGQAPADSPYCSLASIVADICVADDMSGMDGCEAHVALCANSSKVEQCTDPGVLPNLPTTFETKNSIDGVCTTHAMDGCQDCTSTGRTNFRSCPEVFNIYGKLCISMPYMPQCQSWTTFCANADVAAALPLFCTGDAADGSSSALPPMKMYAHQSTRDIFLFKEWVPNSTGQYIGMCIGMAVLAVFTQLLKAVRLRVEMRWSAKARQAAGPCCGLARASPSAGSSASDDSALMAAVLTTSTSKGSELGEPGKSCCAGAPAPVAPPCCAGGAAAAAPTPSQRVPRSRRSLWWRRSVQAAPLTCCGVRLITRDQVKRNFWRAAFTFVVVVLDYALMLVVMTFNIGIILSVALGFAVGALLFGHAGEQAGGAATRHMTAGGSADDLEAIFVEGPSCCSGGGGCGSGGHGGGQV